MSEMLRLASLICKIQEVKSIHVSVSEFQTFTDICQISAGMSEAERASDICKNV